MKALNYPDAFEFDEAALGAVVVATPEIAPIWTTFVSHIERIRYSLDFPIRTWILALMFERFATRERIRLGIDHLPVADSDQDKAVELFAERNLWAMIGQPVTSAASERALKYGANQIEKFSGDTRSGLDHGASATLAMSILQAWTAFEVLVTDLWVEAANQRPISLGQNSVKAIDGQQGKNIQIARLREYGFDLRGKMGTFLKEERKFGFNQLPDMALAYRSAFNEDVIGVFAGPDSQELKYLEAMRNVWTHRNGKADSMFRERMRLHPVFKEIGLGDQVPIEGGFVTTYVNLVIRVGATIGQYVDKWLQDHPGE
jgi:hypothetical protein